MLYRYSEIFRTLLMLTDLALIAVAWLAAYAIRFRTDIPAPLGVPDLALYVQALLVILPTWFWVLRGQRLYEPRRTDSLGEEAGLILRSTAVALVVLLAANFFVRDISFSRGAVAIFAALAPCLLMGQRIIVRGGLRTLRRRGYNLRYVVIVGGGQLAGEIIERIHAHPEAGLRVYGALAPGSRGPRHELGGVSVLADYEGLKEVLERTRIDQVIIALPRREADGLEKILASLDEEHVSVKLAPDLLHIMTLRSSVESLDGLPIINLRESPMLGWAAVHKRVLDLLLSAALLTLAAPVMALVSVAILASSGRPVLFAQRRTGLDGHGFRMLKFRTMVSDAEVAGEPVWPRVHDPRRTRLGAFLRRFSLDELPQLWNVLRGDMSLVGPRPERPVFVRDFRREIPGYMLRLKVKAGLTGWAQIHGWRGDTSLHERVKHDIYYIQNWSLALDVWILMRTAWSTLLGRNAH